MKYIALTIGPIYETLLNARKTRELWAGSYLFSYFMKTLIKELKEKKGFNFIIPYEGDEAFKQYANAGLFHDRFIAKPRDADSFDELQKSIDNGILNLANIISHNATFSKNDIVQYLKEYMQINSIELETASNDPIAEINEKLDAMELMYSFPMVEPKSNPLTEFFANINGSFLKKDAFGTREESFESLYEIAPKELIKKLQRAKHDEFMKELQKDDFDPYSFLKNEFADDLKQYHKYFAILRADGDSFGTHIKNLNGNEQELEKFSKLVFEYTAALPKIIDDFGGTCVFAGGDDLLAFMPIVYKDKTLFDAIGEIDKSFTTIFSGIKVTLSFGASITYHKYPLYEALDMSYKALEKAKSITDENGKNPKNAICIKVTKHSGQSFDLKLYKSNDNYKIFTVLLKNVLTDKNVELPHALSHKLDMFRPIIEASSFQIDQIPNLFKNFFNESEHKGKFKKGLDDTELLLTQILQDNQLILDKPKQDRYGKPYTNNISYKLDVLFSALSIIKLLRGDR